MSQSGRGAGLSVTLVAAMALMVFTGRGWAVVAAAADKVPDSLVDVGEFGENIYDAAKTDNWDAAAKKMAELKKAAALLRTDMPEATAEQKKGLEQLNKEISTLDKALGAKQHRDALIHSNQVTIIAADLSAPFHPKIPVAVTRLDYLGRELEIWAAADDLAKLAATAEDLKSTWEGLREATAAKGGTAEAGRFSALVKQIGSAKKAEDYHKVALPILDEVDNLEKVFAK